jgi:hypothetical protein
MSANRMVCSPLFLRVKVALVAATPPLAMAAEQVRAVTPVEQISILTWLFILVFAMIGWAVADVDKLAELWNVEGMRKYDYILARLKLLKTIIGSLAAGVFTYFIGKISPAFLATVMGLKFENGKPPELHEFLLLIMVAGAGYLGSRWFERAFGAK